jgi:hypothetical protein
LFLQLFYTPHYTASILISHKSPTHTFFFSPENLTTSILSFSQLKKILHGTPDCQFICIPTPCNSKLLVPLPNNPTAQQIRNERSSNKFAKTQHHGAPPENLTERCNQQNNNSALIQE